MKRLFAGISLIAALAALMPAGRGGTPVMQVGQPFPDLVLPAAADGRPWSVAAYRGDKLMLHLFASW